MSALGGKRALVTGGASGIGRATVERLAAEGASVAVLDVDEPGGRAAADAVGGRFVGLDVRDPGTWAGAVAEVEDGLGGLDVAVLNAGITCGVADVETVDDDMYRRIMGVNVDGVFFGIRAAVPALVRRGGGAIVATASLAGIVAFPLDPLYTATKHAVVGLVRSSAPMLAAKGVRIDAICPGIVDTPLLGDMKQSVEAAGFPLIPPADVAGAVVQALTTDGTGRCWVVQPGRPVEEFRFPGVPGPAGAGAGRTPPMPGRP